jgi:hypothetical protein
VAEVVVEGPFMAAVVREHRPKVGFRLRIQPVDATH